MPKPLTGTGTAIIAQGLSSVFSSSVTVFLSVPFPSLPASANPVPLWSHRSSESKPFRSWKAESKWVWSPKPKAYLLRSPPLTKRKRETLWSTDCTELKKERFSDLTSESKKQNRPLDYVVTLSHFCSAKNLNRTTVSVQTDQSNLSSSYPKANRELPATWQRKDSICGFQETVLTRVLSLLVRSRKGLDRRAPTWPENLMRTSALLRTKKSSFDDKSVTYAKEGISSFSNGFTY